MKADHEVLEEIAIGLLALQGRGVLRVWIDGGKIYISPVGNSDARRRCTWSEALQIIELGEMPAKKILIRSEIEPGHKGKLRARRARKP